MNDMNNMNESNAGEGGRYDHGPDCDCGCHDHDHGNHSHSHEHGNDPHGRGHEGHHHHEHHEHEHHEHDYEHEDLELANARVTLEAHTHEQTATVSMTFHAMGSGLEFDDLVTLMREIAAAVEGAGGIVGHIKAYAKQDDAFAHASVTAADLAPEFGGAQDMKLSEHATIQLAAIALLVGQDDLLAICKDALGKLGHARGNAE